VCLSFLADGDDPSFVDFALITDMEAPVPSFSHGPLPVHDQAAHIPNKATTHLATSTALAAQAQRCPIPELPAEQRQKLFTSTCWRYAIREHGQRQRLVRVPQYLPTQPRPHQLSSETRSKQATILASDAAVLVAASRHNPSKVSAPQ